MIPLEPLVRAEAHADFVLAFGTADHPHGLGNGMPHELACHHGIANTPPKVDNTSSPQWPRLAGVLNDGDLPPRCTVAERVVPR